MRTKRVPDTALLDGLSAAKIRQITGTSPATARRWKAGYPVPEPARRLLILSAQLEAGELGLAMPFKEALLRDYQARQRRSQQADAFTETWEDAPEATAGGLL
jgi:hypothetical protein